MAAVKQEIWTQVNTMLEEYETQLIDDILYDAMTGIYGCRTPLQTLELIQAIYQGNADKKFVELMVKSQLINHQNTIQRMQTNKADYQRKFAMVLNKIKQEKIYKSLNAELRQNINVHIQELPTNLHYLLFRSHFCLMNLKYSEYLYTTVTPNSIDPSSSHV